MFDFSLEGPTLQSTLYHCMMDYRDDEYGAM